MTKRKRNKKEKMRLARLSASKIGKVFTEKDDDKTILEFVEAHKNEIPKNRLNEVWKIVEKEPALVAIEPELTEEELFTRKAHEATIAGRQRAATQLALEKEQLKIEAEEKAKHFAENAGYIEDEKNIERREAEEKHIEEPRMKENIFDGELAKFVREHELYIGEKEVYHVNDITLEQTRSIEQARLIEEFLSSRNNLKKYEYKSETLSKKLKEEENRIRLETNIKEEQRSSAKDVEKIRVELQSEYIDQALLSLSKKAVGDDSEALSKKLKEEENRIRLETNIKEEQRFSAVEVEKIRVKTQNKYIVQALLALSQRANEDENDENDKLNECEVAESEVAESDNLIEDESDATEKVNELEVKNEDVIEEVAKPVNQKSKRKIQIIKSSINGKGILLVKRDFAKATGLDDANNALFHPGALKEAKPLEENREIEGKFFSESFKEGISIINENGIDYVTVNGIKIDTKNKVIKTLGIDENLLKEMEHQKITKDDGVYETVLEDTESSIRKELKKKSSKKKRKIIIIWIVVLMLFAGGFYVYNFFNVNRRLPWTEEKLTGADSITYMNVKVEEQITNPKVKITGSLEATNLQTVVLRTNGAIKSINVQEGDIVKKGDILVTVDDTTEQYNIANLKSQLKSAQLTGNANNVKLLELQLDNAKNNLEYTKAKANFDGVVAEQGWTVGDYNSLTINNSNNMIIADLSKFKAIVAIDELDIGYVEVGEEVELSFDSLPGTTVNAFVSKIPMLGYYSKQGFGVLNVEITIPNPPKQLKTGFTFSGTIIGANEETIVVVDQAAITSSGDNSILKMKMPDGSLKEIPVTVRYLGENKCQILSGDIYIGDTVVIENTKSFAEENGINLGL